MTKQKQQRTDINDELKRQIVERLVKGEITVADVTAEHNVHPYQVQAWVGQMTLGQGRIGRKYKIAPGGDKVHSAKDAPPRQSPADQSLTQMVLDQLAGEHVETDDPVRGIGEWYLRNVVMKGLKIEKPKS